MVGLPEPYCYVVDFFSDIVLFLVAIDILALFLLLFLEKYDPRTFVSWLILLVFLPPVGFILYMYMGAAYYRRSKFQPVNITDRDMTHMNEFHAGMMEEDAKANPGREDMAALALSLRNAGAWGYSNDNSIELFTEGKEKMDRLFDDVRNAKRSILIEYYIIRNDQRGNELMRLLTEKVREGVEVRLLTDGFGIGKGPKEGIYRFVNAGGHYAMFHSGWNLMLSPKKNNRNHRKIAVIDGCIGYCGGFNIGDEYEGKGPLGHWRDASVRIEGSGIIPLFVRFSKDWGYARRRDPLGPIGDYIRLTDCSFGHDRLQLVSGGPDTMPNNPVEIQYLAMIAKAKRLLYITTPYLIPDDSMMLALGNAARAGVDVRILIPGKKDHIFMYWNNRSFAEQLRRMGVKVYIYNDGFIHEKVLIMDDIFVSVGSANFDNRSLVLNFESNLMIYSERIRDQAYGQFMSDLERSTEYTADDYAGRNLMMRVRTAVSRMFKLMS